MQNLTKVKIAPFTDNLLPYNSDADQQKGIRTIQRVNESDLITKHSPSEMDRIAGFSKKKKNGTVTIIDNSSKYTANSERNMASIGNL